MEEPIDGIAGAGHGLVFAGKRSFHADDEPAGADGLWRCLLGEARIELEYRSAESYLCESSTASAGSHTIVIDSLAQTSSQVSSAIADPNDTLSGSVTIQGHTFNVDSADNDTTLATLASAINSAGIGVSASVITDSTGSRLSLVSGTSGAAGQLTVSASLSGASSGRDLLRQPAGREGCEPDSRWRCDYEQLEYGENAIPG